MEFLNALFTAALDQNIVFGQIVGMVAVILVAAFIYVNLPGEEEEEAADEGNGGKNALLWARYFRDVYVLDLEHELLQGVAHGTCVLYAHIAKQIVCKLGNLVHGL